MAKGGCEYTIPGLSKPLSENEFKAHLLNGGLDSYVNEGIEIKGYIPTIKEQPIVFKSKDEFIGDGEFKIIDGVETLDSPEFTTQKEAEDWAENRKDGNHVQYTKHKAGGVDYFFVRITPGGFTIEEQRNRSLFTKTEQPTVSGKEEGSGVGGVKVVYRGSDYTTADSKENYYPHGYYKGVHFFFGDNAKEKAKGFGKNISSIDITGAKLYELKSDKDADALKKEASKNGYHITEASGNPESEYLKSLGYDGVKRGDEVIIFEPSKFKTNDRNIEGNSNERESGIRDGEVNERNSTGRKNADVSIDREVGANSKKGGDEYASENLTGKEKAYIVNNAHGRDVKTVVDEYRNNQKEGWQIPKEDFDKAYADVDKIEAEIKAQNPIDIKNRKVQLQLEQGQLDKAKRIYDSKQLPTEAERQKIKHHQVIVDGIKQQLAEKEAIQENIDKEVAKRAIDKYPNLFEAKETFPFYRSKGGHKDLVSKAVKGGTYDKAIANGEMTATEAAKIITSAKLEVPKSIQEKLNSEQTKQRSVASKDAQSDVAGDQKPTKEVKAEQPNQTKETISEKKVPTNAKDIASELLNRIKNKSNEKESAPSAPNRQEGRTTTETKESRPSGSEVVKPTKRAATKGTRKANRKIKNPSYIKALSIETTNPNDVVSKYFIEGGKINSGAIQELFGNKTGKSTNAELRARIDLINREAPSIKQLAHQLWENQPEGLKYTDRDYINAIESVMNGFNSRSQMADDLNSRYQQGEQKVDPYEQFLRDRYGENLGTEEDVNDAVDIVEGMTEDEINTLLSKDSEQDIDNFIQPLALKSESTNPQNRVSFEKLGITQSDTIEQVLDKLISYDGEYSDIFNTIKNDENLSKLKVEIIDDRKGGENGEAGLYYPTENKLQIWNKDNVYYTAAHELMHWFTLDSKAAENVKDTQSYKAIDDLYNYLSSKKGKPVAGLATMESYGLTNTKEFMAELLINPTFRNYVSDVYAENKNDIFKTSKDIRDSKAGSILDIIKNFFQDLFNSIIGKNNDIPFNEKKSVVDNAVKLSTDLFFKGQDITKGQTETGEGAKVLGMGSQQAAALAFPAQFNEQEVDPIINEFVKELIKNGVSEEEIKKGLTDEMLGLTDEEAQKYIDANRPPGVPPQKPRIRFSENPSKQERIRGAFEHLMKSNIPDAVKEKFKSSEKGITYKVADNQDAQNSAKAVIKSFGTEESLQLARLNTFNPAVNSAIFSEAINDYYNKERDAKTQADKFENAKRWADTYNEYAELLTASGQFGQYAYQFYKTSTLGFILSAKQRLNERRDYFLKKDERGIRETWESLKDLPEFQEIFREQVEEAAKKSKREIKKEAKQKISDAWDKLKLNKNQTYAVLVPPPIINGAIEAMKQAHLLGYEVADIIKEGINYINSKHKEGWDEDKFRKDFTPIAEKLVSETTIKRPSLNQQEKILAKWEKKLSKLDNTKRRELLSRVLDEIVKNGGLEYEQFKQMYADALGLPSLTPEMEQRLRELGSKLNEVDVAKEKLDADASQENIDVFIKASQEGEIASRKINDLLGEKGITLDRFLSIAKLNTLGVANLLINPFFNVWFMPIRFLESLTKTAMDYGLKYTGFERSDGIYENTFFKNRGYFKGFGQGLKKSIVNLYSGDSQFDYFQKATRQNIQPLESAKDIIGHYRGQKRLTKSELANAMMEAFPTMGASAAIISRGLQVGDLPFRFAAERAAAENIAAQKGLKGLKREAFILSPDEESKEKIKDAGERAVMSQDNILTGALNTLSAYLKNATSESKARKITLGLGKIVGATTQPFLKIPLNSAMTAFELAVPEFAVLRGLYHATNGNRDLALNAFARAAVGYSIGMALSMIAKAGLVSGTDDDKDKVNASIYKGDYVGDNTINYTGLKRWLRGGDPTYKNGDVTMNLNWLGIPGAIMQMQAQKYDKMTPEQWDKAGYFSNLWERMDGSFVNGLKNNVFGNTSTLLNAMDGGGSYYMNKWMRGSSNVLLNSFEPSWLSMASKNSDKFKVDYSAMDLKQQLSATLKERFWNSDDLPKQITVWGQKRTDAPPGTNPTLYYYADITKSRPVDTKDFGFNVLALYNRTKDDSVIPSRPQKTIRSKNQSIKLDPKQYEDFQIMVGKNRKELTMALMNTYDYNEATDEQKIDMLKQQYENGYKIGKQEFMFKYPNIFPQNDEEE